MIIENNTSDRVDQSMTLTQKKQAWQMATF
jgi:hypothetical protein